MSINLPDDFGFKQIFDDFSHKIDDVKPNDKIKTVEEVCEGIFDQMKLDSGQKKRFYEEIKDIKKAPFKDQNAHSIEKIKKIFETSILSLEESDSAYASFSQKQRMDEPISFFDLIYALKKMIMSKEGDLNLSKDLSKFLQNYLHKETFLLSEEEKIALGSILNALEENISDPVEIVKRACDTYLSEQYLTYQSAFEFVNEKILSLPDNQEYCLGISDDGKIPLQEIKTIQSYLIKEVKRICTLKPKACKKAYNITLSPEKRNADLYHINQSFLDRRSLSLQKGSKELTPIKVMVRGIPYEIPTQYNLDLYENQRSRNTTYYLNDIAYMVKNKIGAEELLLRMYEFCDLIISKDVPKSLLDLFKSYMLVFTTQHLQNSFILCSRSFVSTLKSVLCLSDEIDPAISSKIVYKDKKNQVSFSRGSQENSVKISLSYQGVLDLELEETSDPLIREEFEKARKVLDICEPLSLKCEASFEVRVNRKKNTLESFNYQNDQSLMFN